MLDIAHTPVESESKPNYLVSCINKATPSKNLLTRTLKYTFVGKTSSATQSNDKIYLQIYEEQQ